MQRAQRSTRQADAHNLTEFVHLDQGRMVARAGLDALEDFIRAGISEGALEQTHHDGATPEGDAEATHAFGDGVYVRGVFIPAGCVVVGKIHRQARVCIVAQGTCTFVDEFHRETVSAPWCGEFSAGCKTAVYAHTDTTWYAAVGTDMKDPIEILTKLSAPSYEQLELEDKRCRGWP
jgi:hypothetical protein